MIKITKDSMKNLSEEQIELKCRVNKFYQLKNGHIILATHGEGIFILDNNRIIADILSPIKIPYGQVQMVEFQA